MSVGRQSHTQYLPFPSITESTTSKEIEDMVRLFINGAYEVPQFTKSAEFNRQMDILKENIRILIKPSLSYRETTRTFYQDDLRGKIINNTQTNCMVYRPYPYYNQFFAYISPVLERLILMKQQNIDTMSDFEPAMFLTSLMISYCYRVAVLPSDFIEECLHGYHNEIPEIQETNGTLDNGTQNGMQIEGEKEESTIKKMANIPYGNYSPFLLKDYYNATIKSPYLVREEYETQCLKKTMMILFGVDLWIQGLTNKLRGTKNSCYKVAYRNMKEAIIRLAHTHPLLKDTLKRLEEQSRDPLQPLTHDGLLRIVNLTLSLIRDIQYDPGSEQTMEDDFLPSSEDIDDWN